MAGRNNKVGPGLGYLPGLDAAIEHALIGERHRPGSAACTTAVGAVSVGVEFADVIAASPGNGSALFEIGLAEGLEGFAPVVAGIMIGNSHGMNRLIQLNLAFLDVFEEQIEDGDDFEFVECFGVPLVQPGPGCEICVASLGEEENLAVQPPHVVDNPADYGFHRFIVAGKQTPVDSLPVFR